MLNKEIPFLRIGLPLCAGIVTGLYINPGMIFYWSAIILIISVFFISLYYNKLQENIVYGLAFSAALFLCGLLLYTNEKDQLTELRQGPSQFICTVSDFPVEKEKTDRIDVKLNSIKSSDGFKPVNGSIVLYNKKEISSLTFLPGDILVINCTPIAIMNRGNPQEFDYRFYMQNQSTGYYAFTRNEDIFLYKKEHGRNLLHNALIIRKKIIDMYENRGVKGDTLAIVAAITLGQKNMLDPDQKQNFIKAGVMHIMAVSGLHAVILSYFIFKLLFFVGGRFKVIRIVVTIILLWGFAFVTGLTPSVLRATFMFSFIQAGMLMKRPVNSINSVLASAFVLILIRPSVIFDAGFQLSYAAVIFIICFYQNLYSMMRFKRWLSDQIWQSVAISFIAQAGTLSLTIMLFNRFPVWFMISNILIIPLSSLIIILACLVPLLYPVVFLSGLLARVLAFLTGFTETLTQKISELPYSSIENIGMTGIESFLLIIFIWITMTYLLNKESFPVKTPLIALLLLCVCSTATNLADSFSKELFVYNTQGSSTIGIRTGKVLNIFSDTTVLQPDILKQAATRRLKIRIADNNVQSGFVKTGNKGILITNYLNKALLTSVKPDIIILTGEKPVIRRDVPDTLKIKRLIVTPAVSSSFRLPAFIESRADTIHFVRKSGAYISTL